MDRECMKGGPTDGSPISEAFIDARGILLVFRLELVLALFTIPARKHIGYQLIVLTELP